MAAMYGPVWQPAQRSQQTQRPWRGPGCLAGVQEQAEAPFLSGTWLPTKAKRALMVQQPTRA
jgi:hypothetical protein